jgi:hypothetical protein
MLRIFKILVKDHRKRLLGLRAFSSELMMCGSLVCKCIDVEMVPFMWVLF